MFKEISIILLFVKDIEASKRWYKEFLAIEPTEDLSNFVSFKIGSVFLNLHKADELSPASKGGTVAYWSVDNIHECISKAISLGGSIYRGPLYVKETLSTIVQIVDPLGSVFGLESKEIFNLTD